jgi:hypothetical protein
MTQKAAHMDFIFMLTRHDRTVTDCLEIAERIRPIGLRHVGFKDVGVAADVLAALTRTLKAQGAAVYLEVVSIGERACLESARNAVELGVDCLLGGTGVAATQAILAGTPIRYFPFPGRPHDHPTKLGGTAAQVGEDCRRFRAAGCAGADLLAYRATEASPAELVRSARAGLEDGRLIVAGSIAGRGRLREIAAAGADAFTVGSAVFDGSWAPHAGTLEAQLRAVLADRDAVVGAA